MAIVMWTDVDEVLGGFMKQAYQTTQLVLGRTISDEDYDGTVWDMMSILSKEEIEAVVEVIERPGWCYAIQPLPGAQDAVKELRKHVDLYACTSPFHSQTWVYERSLWLGDFFGFTKDHIIHTAAKHRVKAHIALDDKPSHVHEWQAEHPEGLAMLWHIHQTRNMPGLDKHRVRDWDEVIRRVVDFKWARGE